MTAAMNAGFRLTEAVRPAARDGVRPREGYRVQIYRDRAAGIRLPMLSASVSKEKLFDAFFALIEPLGETVQVVLESSHCSHRGDADEFRRDDVDTPVLLSHFCDYEDLLVDDGCTGVAVMCQEKFAEVQFDEHKLLHVYAPDLKPFRRVLREMGIRRREHLPLVSEGEHLHRTTDEYAERFTQFASLIGAEDSEGVFTDDEFEY